MCSCFSAEAQTSAKEIFPAQPPSAPMTLLFQPSPRNYSSPKVFLVIGLFPQSPDRFTGISTGTYALESSLESRFSITEDRTPFITESTMPVAELWGGRLQLEGFHSTLTRDPQFASSGVGRVSRPASHDQADVNRSVDLDGLSIRFDFRKGPSGRPTRIWRCFGRILDN
jgi:hypothetical protein